jgi:hypothetical protein
MRTCLSLIAASLVASAVSAQATTTNQFEIYPHSSDFFSRAGGIPGTSVGDYLIEMRGTSHRGAAFPTVPAFGQDTIGGFGDINKFSVGMGGTGKGRIAEFVTIFIDGNGSTSEGYNFVIVKEDTATPRTPGASPPGNPEGPEVLLRTTTVPLPAPLLGLPYIWTAGVTYATLNDVVPTNATWYWGTGFSSNPAFFNDGITVESASFYGLGSPSPNLGDNVKDNETTVGGSMGTGLFGGAYSAPTWGRDVTLGTVNHHFQLGVGPNQSFARVPHMWCFTEGQHLQWANNVTPSGILRAGDGAGGTLTSPNPNFGYGGFHPDLAGTGHILNATKDHRVVQYGLTSATPSSPPYAGRIDPGTGLATGDGLDIVGAGFQNAGGTGLMIIGATLSTAPLYFGNPGFIGSVDITLAGAFGVPDTVFMNGEFGLFGALLIPSSANGIFAGLVLAAQHLSSGGPLPFNPNRWSNSAKTNF